MVPTANNAKLGLKFNEDSARRATLATQDLLQDVFGMHNAVVQS